MPKAPQGWSAVIFRHLATIVLAVTILWTIAKPHAEAFIRTTVNERITRVENKLDEHNNLLHGIIRRLDIIRKEVQ